MQRLTRDDLKVLNLPVAIEVEIPVWERSVLIQKLTARAVLEMIPHVEGGALNGEGYITLIQQSVVDDERKPLFTREDVESLDAEVFNLLAKAAGDLNGMNPASMDQARAAVKNPPGASASS